MKRRRGRDSVVARSTLPLYLTPLLWGATFPGAKLAIEPLGPLPLHSFMAWSRSLGFVTLLVALPLVARSAAPLRDLRAVLAPGALLGALIFVGYTFQTWGLELTTATNAGFITGLYVVFAPVLGLVLFRSRVRRSTWLAVVVSLVGLALLSITSWETLTPRAGDLLVLASAVAWAGQIVALGRYAPRTPPLALALAQMGFASLFHVLAAAAGAGGHAAAAASVWPLLVVTGVLGSGVAFTLQVVGQRQIDPARAVIILAGESIAAALFAAVWIDERLALHQWMGAALVLMAMVISELGARRREAAMIAFEPT